LVCGVLLVRQAVTLALNTVHIAWRHFTVLILLCCYMDHLLAKFVLMLFVICLFLRSFVYLLLTPIPKDERKCGSNFLSNAPQFLKELSFQNVPKLRPFVLLVGATCRWMDEYGAMVE